MSDRPGVPDRSATAPSPDAAFMAVVVGAVVLAVLVTAAILLRGGAPPGSDASPPVAASATPAGAAAFLLAEPRLAPPLDLVDQTGVQFSLDSLRGEMALVFFGYTHCPDVCPATMGVVTEAVANYGPGARIVFVTIDPERDTTTWLADYARYMPAGFVGLTGDAAAVRRAADGWGARYARVEGESPDSYTMSHTADVYVVDAAGRWRATIPFGTQSADVVAALREIALSTPGTPLPPTARPTTTQLPSAGPTEAAEALGVAVVSSSNWAGGATPVILELADLGGPLTESPSHVTVRVLDGSGRPVGEPVAGVVVEPQGIDEVAVVAVLDFASSGWWSIEVDATVAGRRMTGIAAVPVLDPGGTAALGQPAPSARTPTLDDVDGVALAVTTDYLPDLRLSRTSTVDALTAGEPFVLVIDSARFKVSPACGTSIQLAKDLLDRWPWTTFIHLEPYRYSIVTDTAMLEGSLAAPTLVPAAEAWGAGSEPWGAGSMPWVFVVDATGSVVAKYQGVVGSADVDVVLTLLAASGGKLPGR